MTIEELEAKLEIATKHRDAWKKMLDETNGHVRDLGALVEPGLNRHPITVIQAAQAFIRTLVEERDEAQSQRAITSANYVIAMDALETATRERDEAKKEAAESSKEMIMLYNDHSSVELEKQLRIEELTRERDEAIASLSAARYAEKTAERERDEARAEVERLEAENEKLGDAWYQKIVQLGGCSVAAQGLQGAIAERGDYGWSQSYADVLELRRKYDEKRAEVERLREECRLRKAERVQVERNGFAVTKGLVDESERMRAKALAYDLAYRRGAEAMREACIDWCKAWESDGESIAVALEDLSIPEEP